MKQFFHCSWQVRTLLLLCLTLQLPFVEGGGSLTPSASAQQNTIRIGNVNSLKELIRQIESQTSYRVSYQGNLADNIPVKVDPSKHNVEELLADALRPPRMPIKRSASPAASSTPKPRSRLSVRRSGSRIRRWVRQPM